MKRITRLALCVILAAACLVGCKPAPAAPQKPVTGIAPAFTEELGYYNESPSVIESEAGVRYLYYTRNATAFDATTSTIAVRKGVKKGDKWVYGDSTTVLEPSENGWDSKYIESADVIAGNFEYNGEKYSYLMAYAATDNLSGRYSMSIGFALSKSPTEKFVKVGDEPFVRYNPADYAAATAVKGCSQPSLVSYDRGGKFYLFYSLFEPHGKSSYLVETDGSDMNAVKRGGRILVGKEGIVDTGLHSAIVNADWSYDEAHDEFVVVRDYWLLASTAPAVAEAVQVVRGGKAVLYDVPNDEENYAGEWITVARRIGQSATGLGETDDPEKQVGYARVYYACVATDVYGRTLSSDEAELYFTACCEASASPGDETAYLYSASIHAYKVEISREE